MEEAGVFDHLKVITESVMDMIHSNPKLYENPQLQSIAVQFVQKELKRMARGKKQEFMEMQIAI